MRGWLFSAALFLTLLAVPAWAQRGGGGHGGGMGGHVGGMGGGHVGGFSGGYHGAYGISDGYRGAYGGYRGAYGVYGARGWNGYGWRGGGRYPYRPYGWGYWGRGYPLSGWGVGWYPGYGWYGDLDWDDSDFDNSYYNSYPPSYAQSYPSTVYLTPDGGMDYSQSGETQEQIDQLQGEVAQLRAQAQQKSQPVSPKMMEVHYDTVLVYRDGHTETVQNYAISGKTLWVFNQTRARKIPLSEINIPATQRDNQDRGNDFVVPASPK